MSFLAADLDQCSHGTATGQSQQVNFGFIVSGSSEHATVEGEQWVDVSGLQEFFCGAAWIRQRADCTGPVVSTDSGTRCDVVHSPEKSRFVRGCVE